MAEKTSIIDLGAIEPNSLYPPTRAASILDKGPKTLANWRAARVGPPVTFLGHSPFYRGADLLKFIDSGRVSFDPVAPARRRSQR